MLTFNLSTAGLRNINFDQYENDFSFIVGGEIFQCNKLLADFISPKVCKMRMLDKTVNSLEIPISNSIDPRLFELIIGLTKGYSIEIAKDERLPLTFLFKELENTEFLNFISNYLDSLNDSNVISTIKMKSELNLPIDKEISYLSSRFYKIDIEQLKTLTSEQLYYTLTKKGLSVISEDWLFDFITDLSTNKDDSYKSLYEFVEFQNISDEKMKEFIAIMSLDQMNEGIWQSVCRRLENQPIKTNRNYKNNKGDDNLIRIPFEMKNEMKGIISFLNSKYHCNIGQMNIINITTSSVKASGKTYSPNNVVELLTSSSFVSQDEENQWISLDFGDMKVVPSYYTLKSCDVGYHAFHPINWIVEGSETGEVWYELDKQQNNSVFVTGKLKNNAASFAVKKTMRVRYIRIKQIGKNCEDNNTLALAGIELYGTLLEK